MTTMLEPILRWFEMRAWTPFDFQREVWEAYDAGESGLIHSPTGTGKTYAAWLGAVAEWMGEHRDPTTWKVSKRSQAPALRVLWITPLRALAADTTQALCQPLEDIGIPWTVETRTGDTSSAMRSRQAKQLPTALVTTPESLSLLLARENAGQLFGDLRAVIVDEWHELMSTKRGVQTELALARLRHWRPDLRVWGLSATMGNLNEALRTLIGVVDIHTGEVRTGRLVRGHMTKGIHIDSIIPPTMERFPWAGHLGLKLLPQVIEAVESSRTTLIFTNTRNQTEIWYQAILDARPDWAGDIALHHSSLDRDVREWVEDNLREGKLKCVVCTSSLDLGVDFPVVDRVLQVGSPKGAARLIQRAGRSGHQPGVESRVTCVPAHAFELIEVAAARDAVQHGEIEARKPQSNSLDVLAQHLVTVAMGGGFKADDLYREVRTTHAFAQLSESEWAWALDFVARGGTALNAYPQYNRVTLKDGRYMVENDDIARTHRMSIGTITSDATLNVQYLKGGKIGHIDESFVSRLRPGDRFTLGGKVLQFVQIRDMTVWVRRAKGSKGVVPRWYGSRMPISETLTGGVRAKLQDAVDGCYDSPEMAAVRPILELQAKWSVIPSQGELLIERVQTRDGHHLFFYPFEGRLVHEGLAALMAFRLSRLQPITFTLAANDYGFELLSPDAAPLDAALDAGLVSTEHLIEDILYSLNATEMAKRQFREIARIAGLVSERFAGGYKTTKQLQVSSSLIFDVLVNYDSDNLLLEQARREVLEQQLERSRLHHALSSITRVTVRDVRRPTPFAFPLMVDRLRQTVSSETLEDRIRRMVSGLEREA
jgi:ATP-dependent Lhr-like helicase